MEYIKNSNWIEFNNLTLDTLTFRRSTHNCNLATGFFYGEIDTLQLYTSKQSE